MVIIAAIFFAFISKQVRESQRTTEEDIPDLESLWIVFKSRNFLALVPFIIYESFVLAFNINICKHLAGFFYDRPHSTQKVKFTDKGQLTRVYISLGFYGIGKLISTLLLRPIDR